MAGFLIVNPRSGRGRPGADELAAAARALGVRTHVLTRSEDPVEVARAADADVIGVAGGDGSLAPVAEVALERAVPFVCIPFGTRNHFARGVGLDRDEPLAALAAFESTREIRVDVAHANGRLFLNNVSFGIYARLIHRREAHRRRRDAFARLRAVWLSLRQRHPVALVVDGDPIAARAVLVANNAYELDLFDLGVRERIDEGVLHLYAAEGLLPHTWEARSASRFRIDAVRPLRAALDGEPLELRPPIELRTEPLALRLRLPG